MKLGDFMALNFKPNCRYNHGDLVRVKLPDSDKFAYVMPTIGGLVFKGHLYICKTCGYTEFFDDEVESTILINLKED